MRSLGSRSRYMDKVRNSSSVGSPGLTTTTWYSKTQQKFHLDAVGLSGEGKPQSSSETPSLGLATLNHKPRPRESPGVFVVANNIKKNPPPYRRGGMDGLFFCLHSSLLSHLGLELQFSLLLSIGQRESLNTNLFQSSHLLSHSAIP